MTSKLDQLKALTTVVADTGDLEAIARLQPVDATTNPSLLLKATALPRYQMLLRQAVQGADSLSAAGDLFAVSLGKEILGVIPGRISTEVDARLSFDRQATLRRARELIALYEAAGIGRERVLIKIAATWEGISAARELEQSGIRTNLTLLFSFAQAQACADAGVFLISPFVGRIYDWYKKAEGRDFTAAEDPGVQSVARIYRYYKSHGFATVVMGASFRNLGQIEALAGCDRLTIGPGLLDELAAATGDLPRRLSPASSPQMEGGVSRKLGFDEKAFRFAMNEDAMGTEKLAEGIRGFVKDLRGLRKLVTVKLG